MAEEPTVSVVKFEEIEFELFYFSNPMFHEDWHRAEEMGLSYLYYSNVGPDYWDDSLVFCKKEQQEIAKKWNKEND